MELLPISIIVPVGFFSIIILFLASCRWRVTDDEFVAGWRWRRYPLRSIILIYATYGSGIESWGKAGGKISSFLFKHHVIDSMTLWMKVRLENGKIKTVELASYSGRFYPDWHRPVDAKGLRVTIMGLYKKLSQGVVEKSALDFLEKI